MVVFMPDYKFNLMFIGPISIKYIAIFKIVIDLMALSNMENMGGHLAHLGGGLWGFLYIWQYRKGKDHSVGFNRFVDKVRVFFTFKKQPNVKVAYSKPKPSHSDPQYNANRASEQKKIDEILDKISKSGYDSLSKTEKEFLFKTSNRRAK